MVNALESPPVISSSSKRNDAVWERMKNVHSWSILKDKRSDLIFVTRKRLVNWANLHKLTLVSQMERHVFCSKVNTYNKIYLCIHIYIVALMYKILLTYIITRLFYKIRTHFSYTIINVLNSCLVFI